MQLIFYILIVILTLYLYGWYRENVFQKEFNNYLSKKEGSNILFYNNRKGIKKFIESNVISRLTKRIDNFYLDGKSIVCNEDERKFLKRILLNLKNYSKFPHLVKIRDGRIEEASINNEVFNCINQGKSISALIDRINHFFEINDEPATNPINKKLTLEILAKAILEYRNEGRQLMQRLGQKFGYDINIQKQYEELIWRGNKNIPRSGKLSERVNYSFHGGECGFHKRKTKQNIEVILSNPPKFGKIDPWFLKAYLDSTNEYKDISKKLEWQELKPMIEELYRNGEIEEIK